MIWLVVIIVVALLLREIYVATHIQRSPYVDAHCYTVDGSVLLTFDDGPHPVNTPKVLDVLKRHGIHALFFCVGREAERYPDIVRRIVAEGHTVGQHTYFHNPFHNFYGPRHYSAEIARAHQLFSSLGISIRLFRPPLGITNYVVSRAVRLMGYTVIGWSVRSFDTRGEGVDEVMRRVGRQLKPGAVVLLHDRLDDAASLAEAIITTSPYEINRNINIESIL